MYRRESVDSVCYGFSEDTAEPGMNDAPSIQTIDGVDRSHAVPPHDMFCSYNADGLGSRANWSPENTNALSSRTQRNFEERFVDAAAAARVVNTS
ncbi:hypothetical protein PF008_g5938 [Phytophthora fragariae]|uniref:Uncharacterized protein n=1 Tax=Phytophthora fragariae TaxID=53985 RepID=A0A6G0S7J5_9STRA|nr:hypothetical protein PF008_g5938 [Phytophthora fragariae]